MSYVTGSHNLKVGLQIMEGWRHFYQEPNGSLDYTFSNGRPLSLTQYATPLLDEERLKASLGALRAGSVDDQAADAESRPALRLPERRRRRRPTCRPACSCRRVSSTRFRCLPCWCDINPRMGAAYDLFGTGKTAVKFNIGRYVGGEAVDIASANHPVNSSVNATTRTWSDLQPQLRPRLRPDESAGKMASAARSTTINFGRTIRTRTATTPTC